MNDYFAKNSVVAMVTIINKSLNLRTIVVSLKKKGIVWHFADPKTIVIQMPERF